MSHPTPSVELPPPIDAGPSPALFGFLESQRPA